LRGSLPDAGFGASRAHQVPAEIAANAQKAFLAGNDVILSMDSRANRTIADALDALISKNLELQRQLDASVARVLALLVRQAKPASAFAAS
jgi:beta-glucosidase-like glycosyl hydrolase